jgi:hypothetical protein
MDASELWYPEIVHSVPKHEFFIFYVPNVCEMLWNTPKHHFESNGLQWMLQNFGTPKQCIHTRKTSFVSFTCRRLANCSETLPNIILGSMDYSGCFTSFVPQNCAFRPETQALHLFTCGRLAKSSETLAHIILGQWTGMDALQLWYPEIVHSGSNKSFAYFTCRRLAKCFETLANISLGPMD